MCVYMFGSPTGMTWSSGNSRDAIAADTLFFFSLYVSLMIHKSFWWTSRYIGEVFVQLDEHRDVRVMISLINQ